MRRWGGRSSPFYEVVAAEKRRLGLPRDRKRTRITLDAVWGAVRNGRMMVCRTITAPDDGRVEPDPTGAVDKKNPSRTMSSGNGNAPRSEKD